MAKKNNEEEPKDENINNDADDTFGLPEVEYEPLKREEPVGEHVPAEEPVYETPSYESTEEIEATTSEEEQDRFEEQQAEEQYEEEHEDHTYRSHYGQEEERSVWPKVVLIVLLILAAGAALYYFAYYKPKADKEVLAKAEADKKRRAEIEAAKLKEQQEQELIRLAEQRRADSLANIKKEGSIERLAGRTGQYYVIVASAIDDDLLMDFANKLARDGKQVKLIPPFGKDAKFYRLAVEARDTYADAQTAADGMKGGDFGDQLWVVKY